MPPRAFERDRDTPLKRKLQRVRKEIQNYLLPHLTVNVDRLRERLAVDFKADPRPFHRRSEVGSEFLGKLTQLDRFVIGLNPSRLNPRELQECIDQLLEAKAVAMNQIQQLSLRRRVFFRLREQFF